MEPVAGTPTDDPVDRLIIHLRAYVDAGLKKDPRPKRQWSSGVVVVFDTETLSDPSQRLRFGAYQVREHGALVERGVFYAPDLSPTDLTAVTTTFARQAASEGEKLCLRTLAEFVDDVFFGWGLEAGGMIVGFNLPFDLSRLATDHSYTKRRGRKPKPGEKPEPSSHSFAGGFSFTLAERRPAVRVKHLSQRAAFVSFAGKSGFDHNPDRGFFLDVKTLAAALTGRSFSLKRLAEVLGTTPKSEFDAFDGPVTPEMVAYGLNDVQVTWECFDRLSQRYAEFGLSAAINDLYSEASLGKAFLAEMNVQPWRKVQKDFPPEMLGQIMSAYYGGRAEVRIRREITPVIHCDFLSMYPTVCTLMGLWKFIIASGLAHRDATEEVRAFVESCSIEDLQRPELWRELTCLVQVQPDDDVFPVRASYAPDEPATIGLNRLTSAEAMWFALPDVLASKLLSGKAPTILSAIRFEAMPAQSGLREIKLAGAAVRPGEDDFYKLLIDERRRVKKAEDEAADGDKASLNAQQQGLKILANSTSYGIFVELNVEELDRAAPYTLYDFRGKGRRINAKKVERPGRYFHPLLGALITSAARLMLALAERNVLDRGLGWVFCDTDSISIAQPAGLPTSDFLTRVDEVVAYFEPLNPYVDKGSILQREKINYPQKGPKNSTTLRPLNCLAISAKRYVQFDRGDDGLPIIRKGSQHGLGYLLPPYDEPPEKRVERLDRTGVELWQEDLWKAVIAAEDAGKADEVDYEGLRNFREPAPSRYAATNQTMCKWFEKYNEGVDVADRVRPFNFLLSFQAKSKIEMADVDPAALSTRLWTRDRHPLPASRYQRDLANPPPIFDRKNGDPVPWAWLKTYSRALVRHHLHAERKFQNGDEEDRGVTRRRNVQVWAALAIGKEADNLDEREVVGESEDAIEWGLASDDQTRLLNDIEATRAELGVSDREISQAASVSHHTLAALRSGARVGRASAIRVAQAVETLRRQHREKAEGEATSLLELRSLAAKLGGRNKLAHHLGISRPYAGRLLRAERPLTAAIKGQIASNSSC